MPAGDGEQRTQREHVPRTEDDVTGRPLEVVTQRFEKPPNVDIEVALQPEDAAPLPIDLGALVSDAETADADLVYEIVAPPAKGTLSGSGAAWRGPERPRPRWRQSAFWSGHWR